MKKKLEIANILINPKMLVFVAISLYIFYWSFMTIEKFYAMGASAFDAGTSVYDAGLFMETLWSILHAHYTLNSYIDVFFTRGIEFVIFPLAIFKSYQLLFAFQSFMLGIAALFIYMIGVEVLKNRWQALSIAIVYLLYPPLAGVNWTNLHYQMLFIPFFIAAYFFYIKRNYITSVLLFSLAALSHGQYSILVSLFAILEVIPLIKKKNTSEPRENKKQTAIIYILIFSAIISLGFLMEARSSGLGLHSSSTAGTISVIFQGIDTKIETILLIFAPVLFLPFFSKKWLILLFPFIALMFYVNNAVYQFPALFMLQYPSMFIPFVFLGAIYGLSNLSRRIDPIPVERPKGNVRSSTMLRKIKTIDYQVMLTVLSIAILFAVVYQPYGPLQAYTADNFGLENILSSNHLEYVEINSMIDLIPQNTSFVFFQNSMPEVLPRPLEYEGTPLMPYTVAANLTTQLSNKEWVPVTVDYAIFNPYSPFFEVPGSAPYNTTAYEFLHKFMATGQYGILAEVNGMILLEKNYSGPPKLYIPYHAFVAANASFEQGNYIGPLYMSPGEYSVSFDIRVSDNSINNHYVLRVLEDGGENVFCTLNVSYLNFPGQNLWTNVTLLLTLQNAWSSIEFYASATNGTPSETISVRGVNIEQLSA